MNLVINSQFRPFTYDEMVKPLVQYKEAYEKAEQDYSNLAAQTEMWKDIANQTNNPEAYAMYQRYSNDLNAVTEDFSKGMNLNNRSALINMKKRYAQDIVPIARADAARQEAIKYRRETKARDNSSIFKVEDFSVDDFLHGKTVSEDHVSGKDIIARTSAKVEALSRALFSDPEFEAFLDGQKFKITQQNGMTPEMFYAIVNDQLNNPEISDALRTKLQGFRQIMDDEMANVADWGDHARQQVLNSVTIGMYAGLAKPTYNYVENSENVTSAQRQSLAIQSRQVAVSEAAQASVQEAREIASGKRPVSLNADGSGNFSDGTYTWKGTKNPNGIWIETPNTRQIIPSRSSYNIGDWQSNVNANINTGE